FRSLCRKTQTAGIVVSGCPGWHSYFTNFGKFAMKKDNLNRGNNESRNDDQRNDPLPDSLEDGRSKEWQDRGRVVLDKDIAPDAKTNLERDFEPENLRDEKPKDDKVY
ncbi:MAG TPA: hypothetical protein VLC28_02205, partial [Flavitalea sp.]|nr:hypothetical protein [Flavitalea sp.]